MIKDNSSVIDIHSFLPKIYFQITYHMRRYGGKQPHI